MKKVNVCYNVITRRLFRRAQIIYSSSIQFVLVKTMGAGVGFGGLELIPAVVG